MRRRMQWWSVVSASVVVSLAHNPASMMCDSGFRSRWARAWCDFRVQEHISGCPGARSCIVVSTFQVVRELQVVREHLAIHCPCNLSSCLLWPMPPWLPVWISVLRMICYRWPVAVAGPCVGPCNVQRGVEFTCYQTSNQFEPQLLTRALLTLGRIVWMFWDSSEVSWVISYDPARRVCKWWASQELFRVRSSIPTRRRRMRRWMRRTGIVSEVVLCDILRSGKASSQVARRTRIVSCAVFCSYDVCPPAQNLNLVMSYVPVG